MGKHSTALKAVRRRRSAGSHAPETRNKDYTQRRMTTQSRFSALRHRDFRLYWTGFVISVSGQQMQWMIEGWLIYQLSGSALLLGVNGAVQFVPATALTLFGGALADKFDQRRLLIAVQMLFILVLGSLSVLGVLGLLTAWHVIAGGFGLSTIGAFEGPARQAMFPHLVSRESMPSAVALNATIHPATRVLAPTAGGFLSAVVFDASGSASVAGGAIFGVTTLAVVVFVLMLLRVRLPSVMRAKGRTVLGDMGAGVTYLWRQRILAFLIGMAYYNMFFGISLAVLFPVFAKDVLGVGPEGLGLMWGAMGVGSVVGVFIASSLTLPRQQRSMLTGGAVTLGVFMVAFALSQWYWLSLLLLFALGTGASVLNVAIQTNLQMLVANELRGRVMGIWSMVHTSIRPMGELQFGGIAALVSAPFALIASGAIIIVLALGYALPSKHLRQLADLREQAMTTREG